MRHHGTTRGNDDEIERRVEAGEFYASELGIVGREFAEERAVASHFRRACAGMQSREDGAVVRGGEGDEVPDVLRAAEPLDVITAHEPAHAEADEIELPPARHVAGGELGELLAEFFDRRLTAIRRKIGRENFAALGAKMAGHPRHVAGVRVDAVDEHDGIVFRLRRHGRGIEKRERGADEGDDLHRGNYSRRRKWRTSKSAVRSGTSTSSNASSNGGKKASPSTSRKTTLR